MFCDYVGPCYDICQDEGNNSPGTNVAIQASNAAFISAIDMSWWANNK